LTKTALLQSLLQELGVVADLDAVEIDEAMPIHMFEVVNEKLDSLYLQKYL